MPPSAVRRQPTGSGTPWWGLVSATAAPVLLIGGWTAAAARQSSAFDPVVETISALAARGADDRWLMTTALAGLGVCHLTTALALRAAATPGRVVLGVGGAATLLVAAFPLPAMDGHSPAHTAAAGTAFVALAVWPLVARRDGGGPVLGTGATIAGGVVLLGLVGWFFAQLLTDGPRVGLSERVAAGAQALWPMVAAWSSRRMPVKTIRWGVIGSGGIAATFVEDLRLLTDDAAEVVAVGSRSRSSAEAFAGEHGIARAHPSYADLVADDEVDAVYVSTIHPTHHDAACSPSRPGRQCWSRSRSP